MILAPDSSFDRPNSAQAAAAFAGGYRAWGGYLVSDDDAVVLAARNVGLGLRGLAAPWTAEEFAVVQDAGLRAIAFCSGWDDPVALAAKAAALGLLPLLDDEDGIRPGGPWVDPWLQASGFGLYGLQATQDAHQAPYRIVALYPAGGCPGLTWPSSPGPAEPHGWQCQGTHVDPVTGLSIDLSSLDDWFGGAMTPDEHLWLATLYDQLTQQTHNATDPNGAPITSPGQISYTWSTVEKIAATLAEMPVGGGLTAAQAQQLADLDAAVKKIEAALIAAGIAFQGA